MRRLLLWATALSGSSAAYGQQKLTEAPVTAPSYFGFPSATATVGDLIFNANDG